jgi:hypothetical protein
MRASERLVDGPWTFESISGGHRIPLENPEYLNRRLLELLDPPTGAS